MSYREKALDFLVKTEREQTGENPDYVVGVMDALVTVFNLTPEEIKKHKNKTREPSGLC